MANQQNPSEQELKAKIQMLQFQVEDLAKQVAEKSVEAAQLAATCRNNNILINHFQEELKKYQEAPKPEGVKKDANVERLQKEKRKSK